MGVGLATGRVWAGPPLPHSRPNYINLFPIPVPYLRRGGLMGSHPHASRGEAGSGASPCRQYHQQHLPIPQNNSHSAPAQSGSNFKRLFIITGNAQNRAQSTHSESRKGPSTRHWRYEPMCYHTPEPHKYRRKTSSPSHRVWWTPHAPFSQTTHLWKLIHQPPIIPRCLRNNVVLEMKPSKEIVQTTPQNPGMVGHKYGEYEEANIWWIFEWIIWWIFALSGRKNPNVDRNENWEKKTWNEKLIFISGGQSCNFIFGAGRVKL